MCLGGSMAGVEVEGVVGVDAVRGGGETALLSKSVKNGKKLILAEKAAVSFVGAICGIFHFASFHEFVTDAESADEFFHGGAIVSGEAGRQRGNGKSMLAQRALCGPGEVGGIGAA